LTISLVSGVPVVAMTGPHDLPSCAIPDREDHEQMHRASMAAGTAAHGIAETEEIVQVSITKMGETEVGRSALTAIGNHRTLDLTKRSERGKSWDQRKL
jgi:hypothetical protein